MNDRFFVERMKRRGMAGHYVPDPGRPTGLPISPAVLIPQTPSHLPVTVLRPQQQLTTGPLGRNMSYEEAMGHRLWQSHFTMDGNNQLIPVPFQLRQPFAVRRAPWLDLTPGGEAYIFLNPQQIVIGAIASVTTVITFQVPKRKNGNIEWIANQIIGGQGLEGTGLVKWQILLDGVPAKNYDNIPATIGTMSNPADLRESPIRIFENQVVALVLVNIAFNPNQQVLLGMLRGKFWPIEQEGPNTWV